MLKCMKILRLALILLLFFNCFCFAKEIKFIHITDINLSYNADEINELYRTVKEINNYPDIDFVVFGGNNIAKANVENLDSFLYVLKKLKKKCYILLGSTDVSASNGITKKYYLRRIWLNRHFKHPLKPNYVFKNKGNIFVVMDGAKQYFPSSNGYFKKEELLWLDRTLNKYKDKNVIILQHFPILEDGQKWQVTRNAQEYRDILNKHNNVKVLVSGHFQKDTEKELNGVYHIITEGWQKNKSYKIIQIDFNDNFVGTYLVK